MKLLCPLKDGPGHSYESGKSLLGTPESGKKGQNLAVDLDRYSLGISMLLLLVLMIKGDTSTELEMYLSSICFKLR